jgi:hypothetical protein
MLLVVMLCLAHRIQDRLDLPAHLQSLNGYADYLDANPQALQAAAEWLLPASAQYARLRAADPHDGASRLLWESILAMPDARRRHAVAQLAWPALAESIGPTIVSRLASPQQDMAAASPAAETVLWLQSPQRSAALPPEMSRALNALASKVRAFNDLVREAVSPEALAQAVSSQRSAEQQYEQLLAANPSEVSGLQLWRSILAIPDEATRHAVSSLAWHEFRSAFNNHLEAEQPGGTQPFLADATLSLLLQSGANLPAEVFYEVPRLADLARAAAVLREARRGIEAGVAQTAEGSLAMQALITDAQSYLAYAGGASASANPYHLADIGLARVRQEMRSVVALLRAEQRPDFGAMTAEQIVGWQAEREGQAWGAQDAAGDIHAMLGAGPPARDDALAGVPEGALAPDALELARQALAEEHGVPRASLPAGSEALKAARDYLTAQLGTERENPQTLLRARELGRRLAQELAPLRDLKLVIAEIRRLEPGFDPEVIDAQQVGDLGVRLSDLLPVLLPDEAAQMRLALAQQLLYASRQHEAANSIPSQTPDRQISRVQRPEEPVIVPPRFPLLRSGRAHVEPNVAYSLPASSWQALEIALDAAASAQIEESMQVRTYQGEVLVQVAREGGHAGHADFLQR